MLQLPLIELHIIKYKGVVKPLAHVQVDCGYGNQTHVSHT